MVSNTMFILVIAFAAMFSSLSMAQIFDTSVALKGSYREGQRYIAENAHTFKDLLRRGSMFVDKTLLLKVILDDFRNTTVSINYPPKWGKTINLNMIKTFLEIEVDKEGNRISPPDLATNYRLFKSGELVLSKGMQVFEKPFLITQHADIMDKFLGQRPVVYLNFSALNAGAGFNDLCTEIANRISQSFAEHEYMKEVFTKVVNDKSKPNGERDQATENLKMFEKILSKKGNITEVQKSLNFLSSILTNHFKRKAFLLIDDYDTPFNLTFLGDLPRSEDPVFLNFYRKFMYFTVVSNAHVKKTILTGVLPLLKGTLFHPINNSIEYTVLNDTEIHKYYGFSKPDVEQLFQLHETSEKTRQKVYKFFDGYRVSGNSCRTNILETSAVIHLIHSEDIIRTDGHFFRKYFAIDSIRQVLHCLISGLNLPVGIRNITLNRNDFRNLQSAQLYNEVYNGPIVESFLRYSMAAGYITLTEFKLLGKYCVRLANRDISAAIKEGLGRYFTSEFGSNTSKINGHAQHFYTEFVSFTRTENATSEKLKSILEEAYSYVFLPYGSVANENERMAHLVLDYLCTFLKPFKRYPSYSTAILLIDKDAGVIVETTFNKATADEALQKAIRSLLSFYPFRPVKMKYIGINVKSDSKVDIATE